MIKVFNFEISLSSMILKKICLNVSDNLKQIQHSFDPICKEQNWLLTFPSFPILNRFLTRPIEDFQVMMNIQLYFSHNIDFINLL